jgi:hypothetical protein
MAKRAKVAGTKNSRRTILVEIKQVNSQFELSPLDVVSNINYNDRLVWIVVDPVSEATIMIPRNGGSVFQINARKSSPAEVILGQSLALPLGEQYYAVYCKGQGLEGFAHGSDPKIIVKP